MALINIKIIDEFVNLREGVSDKTGKPYKIRSQDVFAELHQEVRKLPINLADNESAYAPGKYTIDPIDLISIGRFGFEFNRFQQIKLVPVSAMNSLSSK